MERISEENFYALKKRYLKEEWNILHDSYLIGSTT